MVLWRAEPGAAWVTMRSIGTMRLSVSFFKLSGFASPEHVTVLWIEVGSVFQGSIVDVCFGDFLESCVEKRFAHVGGVRRLAGEMLLGSRESAFGVDAHNFQAGGEHLLVGGDAAGVFVGGGRSEDDVAFHIDIRREAKAEVFSVFYDARSVGAQLDVMLSPLAELPRFIAHGRRQRAVVSQGRQSFPLLCEDPGGIRILRLC